MVKFFIIRKPQHNSVDAFMQSGGMTALAFAFGFGYVDIARLLLENGATMDFEDKVRRTDMIVYSIYHRLGFDCEILMIGNCDFFRSLQSKVQLKHNIILIHGTGLTVQLLDLQSSLTGLKHNH